MNMKYKKKFLEKKSNKNINIGIQVFRMFLCFWVICDHCLNANIKNTYKIFFQNRAHVPCFVLISFYFSFKSISERNCDKLKKRLERLLIPYIIFPFIILLINNSFLYFSKISIYGYIITFHDLYIQLIIGRTFIDVFWFQFYLIWTTLLFIIISFLFKKYYLLILELIYIISYYLRYSNLNYFFFLQFKSIVQYSVGQFVEVMPISVSGSIIASLNIFHIIKNYYKRIIFFAVFFLYFIYNFNIFSNVKTIAFGGIILDVCSILYFIIFYLLPINNIKSPIFRSIIFQIAKYTQGIYSLHLILFKALNIKLESIKTRSIKGCIRIYIFSYLISFVGEKLTKKTKLIHLFV